MSTAEDWVALEQKLADVKTDNKDPIVYFKMLSENAQLKGLYIPEDVIATLELSERQDLINASGKQSHAGYRKELYVDVFEPLVSAFTAEVLEYWYFCIASALKRIGIVEADTSYCMSECFRSQDWLNSINYAVLLSQIYQAQDESLEPMPLNENVISNSESVDFPFEEAYVLYSFGGRLA